MLKITYVYGMSNMYHKIFFSQRSILKKKTIRSKYNLTDIFVWQMPEIWVSRLLVEVFELGYKFNTISVNF